MESNDNSRTNFLILSEFHFNNNNFQMLNPILSKELYSNIKNKNQITRTWKISPKNIETEIKVGDIIKLGRVRLKFDKIYLKNINLQTINKNSNTPNLQSNNFISNYYTNSYNNINNNTCYEEEKNNNDDDKNSNNSNTKNLCRICYSSESNINNPLISPCKCNGSMQYIHYNCLKQCIEAKIQKKEDENFKFLIWNNFECEICKCEYPKYLKYKNNIYPMVNIENNFESYSICDYNLFDDAKKKTFRKGLIIFKINEDYDEIPIGRTQSNRIKLKDISVSRIHCNLIRKNNKLYIIDKGSKFGTLIYLKKSINMNILNINKNTENLISGRHSFSFYFQQKFSFSEKFFSLNIQCCNYNKYNHENEVDVENLKENISEHLLLNEQNKNLDESYADYILDLENIINAKDIDEFNDNKTNVKETNHK